LESYGFSAVFYAVLIVYMMMFVFSLMGLTNVPFKKKKRKITTKETIKKVWKNKNIRNIYWISGSLDFFYAITVIYVPLHLLSLGLNWEQIGLILTVMLIPFVLLQYPVGSLADTKWGEREMLGISALIMGGASLFMFFTVSASMATWMMILFTSRIGAALLEILRDSYFYKQIDGSDIGIINFFRTARSVAYILATGISAVVLLFFPLKSVFLIAALGAFSALIPVFFLNDSKAEDD
jgi:MFS family permease